MNYIWREIQLMKKLSKIKDNVFTTKLYNVIETEDAENPGTKYVYLIMEYMTMDLQKIIEENPFDNSSEDHLVIIFYNLLCAMSFLHKLGLIHRDIKPANILIDENC
jgi:serine/threonine protein kinase